MSSSSSSSPTAPASRPTLIFTVAGVPIAQGSKRVVPTAAGPRAVESNERILKPWRATVAAEAAALMADRAPLRGPVRLVATFTFPRPRSHYRTGRYADELKDDAPAMRDAKPDVDKLLRALFDALAGIVYVDDAQVVAVAAYKRFGPNAGVRVGVSEWPAGSSS